MTNSPHPHTHEKDNMRKIKLEKTVINLTDLCKKAGWHLGSSIAALEKAGISRSEAENYANFEFNEFAIENGGFVDTVSSDDYLTDEQFDKISYE